MIDLHKYKNFINDYQIFENKYWENAFEEEKEKLIDLKNGFQELEKRLEKINANESPFYNIFEVMNVRHYEEKLHTPFLCNLLNPKSTHGQGALFLDLFFEHVLKLDYRYQNISHFKIIEEHHTTIGRIDIICLFSYNEERIGIVIENKIYAKDQKNQLQRYYDYLTKGLGLKEENRKLYYLSPWKIKASKISMKIGVAAGLREKGILKEIGYHSEIIPWLNRCQAEIKSDKIKFIIQQYSEALAQL